MAAGHLALWRAAVFAAVTTVAAADARARGTIVVVLDYHADRTLPECPGAGAFGEAIARELGHDPFRDEAPRRIVVRLSARQGGVEGRVEWRDATGQARGERTFWSRNESCAELARPIALSIAIQIQLLETAEGRHEETRPEPPAPAPAPPAPPAPVATPVEAPPPPPREPWITVDVGVGLMQDLGDAPATVLPRLAVSVGRPYSFGLRLGASGLGPGGEVSRPEGVAQIDRFVMTLAVVRAFRGGRVLEPFLGLGGGWQDVHVHGISAMPSLAQGHDGHASSWVVAASGGLAFVLPLRLALAAEVEALLYRPSVTVQVGSARAARLDGAALVAHGGLLARF